MLKLDHAAFMIQMQVPDYEDDVDRRSANLSPLKTFAYTNPFFRR